MDEGLLQHNQYRAKHHVRDLGFDDELTEKALQCAEYYAERGTIDHSCPYKGEAGENLAWTMSSFGSPSEIFAVRKAVRDWYNEIKNYNFEHPGNSTGVTGHFTQLVWRGTISVGLGSYRHEGSKRTYTCALYGPKGNLRWFGEDQYRFYRENVLKYDSKVSAEEAIETTTLIPPAATEFQSLDS